MVTWLLLALASGLAYLIGTWLPLLGTAVAAILVGFALRHSPLYRYLDPGLLARVSKPLLQGGIVLLGFNLSLGMIWQVGGKVLILMLINLLLAVGSAIFLGRRLGVKDTLAGLLGIGTSICGGAAIMASTPILKAREDDTAVSITTMFIFSMVSLLVLPVAGNFLNMSDFHYGLLAGAAINDTPSVVAAGFSWSQTAGNVAMVVKMARTLYIIPLTLAIIMGQIGGKQSGQGASSRVSWSSIWRLIPTFIIYFVLAVGVATVFPIPDKVQLALSQVSSLVLMVALVTVGLEVHIQDIKAAGLKPVLIGGASWCVLFIHSLAFIYIFY